MSVTLISMKGGTPKPIKLSIWDAFKGAPSPKPRPHRCNCCNTLHTPGAKPQANAETEAPTAEKPAEDAAKPDEAKQENEPRFTEEEDAKLKELKGDKSFQWAKAAEEIGRSVEDLKRRWKDLKSAENDPKPDEKEPKQDEGKKDEGSIKESKKDKKGKKKKQEEQKKEEEAKPDEGTPEVKNEPSPDAEPAKPVKNKADEKRKWEKAAAKHFDRTGQRITPEQARKIAGAAT